MLTELLSTVPPFVPDNAHFMTVTIEVPPGDAGTPPHRHSGPVFGYVLEGELLYELEGEPERVINAGEAFWEPGGDRIHYQAANNSDDVPVRFVAVMVCAQDTPMLTMVEPEELKARRDRRAPRPENARF